MISVSVHSCCKNNTNQQWNVLACPDECQGTPISPMSSKKKAEICIPNWLTPSMSLCGSHFLGSSKQWNHSWHLGPAQELCVTFTPNDCTMWSLDEDKRAECQEHPDLCDTGHKKVPAGISVSRIAAFDADSRHLTPLLDHCLPLITPINVGVLKLWISAQKELMSCG